MTKFEELQEIIARRKNKGIDTNISQQHEEELEVSGSESSKKPLVSFGNDETDPDLLEQLHRSIKTKPNDGSGASARDSDY